MAECVWMVGGRESLCMCMHGLLMDDEVRSSKFSTNRQHGRPCTYICTPRLALTAGIYGMNFTDVATGEPSMPELKWEFGA